MDWSATVVEIKLRKKNTDENTMTKDELIQRIEDIEFLNPGALPKPLDIIMKEDVSMPRNPVIAKLFRVANLAENAGYGFDKMIDGWKPYARTAPEFDRGFDFTKTVFRFSPKALPETTQKTTQKDEADTRVNIIGYLKKNPNATRNEMAKHLNITPDGIKYHLNILKQTNRIKRVGGRKLGYWKIINNEWQLRGLTGAAKVRNAKMGVVNNAILKEEYAINI